MSLQDISPKSFNEKAAQQSSEQLTALSSHIQTEDLAPTGIIPSGRKYYLELSKTHDETSMKHVQQRFNPHTYKVTPVIFANTTPVLKPQEEIRQTINASRHEKLTYLRALISSPAKTEVVIMNNFNFNYFFWIYVFDVILKIIPSTYVYIFLGLYSPKTHFYLPKMIPLCIGMNFIQIFASFMDLSVMTRYCTMLLHYLVAGFNEYGPWNRCLQNVTNYNGVNVKCFGINDFKAEFSRNRTIVFESMAYFNGIYLFQLSHCEFMRRCNDLIKNIMFGQSHLYLYFMLIWILATIQYKMLFRKLIWKMMLIVQCILNVMLMSILLHLIVVDTSYKRSSACYVSTVRGVFDDNPVWSCWLKIHDGCTVGGQWVSILLQNFRITMARRRRLLSMVSDLTLLADTMGIPPILHVLTARSRDTVNISKDSAILTVNNAVYYLFRAYVIVRLANYVEHIVGGTLMFQTFNPFGSFILWSVYFSMFSFGNVVAVLFFFLNFLMEFIALTITIQILIEAVVWEWKYAKRILVTAVIIILQLAIVLLTPRFHVTLMFIYSKVIISILESVVMFLFYPFGRFIDDLTFYYAHKPTMLRNFSLVIYPIYVVTKFHVLLSEFLKLLNRNSKMLYRRLVSGYAVTWAIICSPLLLGAIYMLIKAHRKKRPYTYLLKPVPTWGPENFYVRQLRKLYDTRTYIPSQTEPPHLSRYIYTKEQQNVYSIEINFNTIDSEETEKVRVENETGRRTNDKSSKTD